MVQRKEQIETPGKELSNKELANLSDTEFKILIIRMLTEMIEYSHKIKEEVKSMQSEIKKNIQGANSEGKETRAQINDLEQKEEINMQLEQNEETRIQKKNEERMRRLWGISRHANIQIIGVSEGEEEEQEIENLFEQIMKESFPNLAKELDMQVQEAQTVPNKVDAKRLTPRHIVVKMPKVKDKERILIAPRE